MDIAHAGERCFLTYDTVSWTVYGKTVRRIDRYIIRQLFTATLFVAITLTGVVWLTQSLRFVEMIVNRGLSVPLFLYFTILLLPTFLGIILPIALFVAVLFTYNRLLVDSELVVLRAGGYSHFNLARPALVLSVLITVACYALTLYFIPASYREFKDLQFTLRNSYPTVLLQEGVFNSVMKGVTVYVRDRGDDGELSGIIVHDARDPRRPITMMAERGLIATGEKGPRVVMVSGNRQEVNEKDGRLSLLYFDRYTFDLSTINTSSAVRWREPRERYLNKLFFPKSQEKKIGFYNKLRMEGHHRLSMPLLASSFTLVGLALLLSGDFNRRGQLWRILSAVSVVVLIEVAQLSFKNVGERNPETSVLMYLSPIIPAVIAAWLLGPWGRKRNRRSAGPAIEQN